MRIAKEDAKINSTKQIQRVAPNAYGATGGSGPGGQNVIEISDQSEATDFMPMRYQAPKALRLNQLAEKASSATENKSLAAIVKEFSEVLKMNSSRTLTREAFYFLDVLYKQLDDPSVFIKPTRLVVSLFSYANSRLFFLVLPLILILTRSLGFDRTSRQGSFNEQVPEKEPAHIKLGVVARLRREVGYSQTNQALAAMVADFAKVTNKSTGRTVTKVLIHATFHYTFL